MTAFLLVSAIGLLASLFLFVLSFFGEEDDEFSFFGEEDDE